MSKTKLVDGKRVPISKKQQADIERVNKKSRKKSLKERYKHDRLKEYPEIGDQLDAILKHLNYMQMDGQTDLINELDDIVGKWLSVKRKYPKNG